MVWYNATRLVEARASFERRKALGIGVGEGPPAPVAERFVILRAALDELEGELATAGPER
jgi:hypothetical protein